MDGPSILPAVWDVPEIFRKRMGTSVGRQRAMFHDGHLLLILHAPPSPDVDEREGRFFWRHPDGTWRSSEQGGGISALSTHLDNYQSAIEACDDMVTAASSAEDYFVALERLSPLLRASSNLHHVLQEARKMVDNDREIINFRDRSYQIERTASLEYDAAKSALDFAVARRAEEQAAASHKMALSAHRLNVMASFFFPVATLSALFGVNMLHGWEDVSPPWPFLILTMIGLASGVLLTAFITQVKPGSKSSGRG